MNIGFNFKIKGVHDLPERDFQLYCEDSDIFLELLKRILKEYCKDFPLSGIAVVSPAEVCLTYQDVRKSASAISHLFGNAFLLKDRQSVNGENLESQEAGKLSLEEGFFAKYKETDTDEAVMKDEEKMMEEMGDESDYGELFTEELNNKREITVEKEEAEKLLKIGEIEKEVSKKPIQMTYGDQDKKEEVLQERILETEIGGTRMDGFRDISPKNAKIGQKMDEGRIDTLGAILDQKITTDSDDKISDKPDAQPQEPMTFALPPPPRGMPATGQSSFPSGGGLPPPGSPPKIIDMIAEKKPETKEMKHKDEPSSVKSYSTDNLTPSSQTESIPPPMEVMSTMKERPPPSPPSPDRSPTKSKKKAKMARSEKMMDYSSEMKSEESDRRKSRSQEMRQYDKQLAVDYYNVMNPEKVYPLTLQISDIAKENIASVVNVITGEVKVREKSDMSIQIRGNMVRIRPVFPGCSVSPDELPADLDKPDQSVTFYITPIVSGDLEGCRLDFLDAQGKIVHNVSTPAKVEDPVVARTITLAGTLISILPKLLEFFGIEILQGNTVNEMLFQIPGFLGNLDIFNFISLAGIIAASIIGGVVYTRKRPKSTKKSFNLRDLRSELGAALNSILGG